MVMIKGITLLGQKPMFVQKLQANHLVQHMVVIVGGVPIQMGMVGLTLEIGLCMSLHNGETPMEMALVTIYPGMKEMLVLMNVEVHYLID